MSLVARLISGDRVHELLHTRGEYLLRLHVREGGELIHESYADRILSLSQAGEWIDTTLACGGFVHQDSRPSAA